jgi:hypothetical protein
LVVVRLRVDSSTQLVLNADFIQQDKAFNFKPAQHGLQPFFVVVHHLRALACATVTKMQWGKPRATVTKTQWING